MCLPSTSRRPHNYSQCARHRVGLLAMLVGYICFASAWSSAAAQAARPGLSSVTVYDRSLVTAPALRPLDEVGTLVAPEVREAWDQFRASTKVDWRAWVDLQTGRIVSTTGRGIAWIPGKGNSLSPADLAARLGVVGPLTLSGMEKISRTFLPVVTLFLGVDPETLKLNLGRSGQLLPEVWSVDFDVKSDSELIEGARVVFRINHGNLVEIGTENLPSRGATAPAVQLSRERALEVVAQHIGGFTSDDTFIDQGNLHLIPITVILSDVNSVRGLAHVWQFTFHRKGEIGNWRAWVDAANGRLLEFIDVNVYEAQATGGVYANSPATGPEIVRPFPFVDLSAGGNTTYSNSGGLYTFNGEALTSTLNGNYVKINDICGSISLITDASGNLAFGTSAGTDCTTPGIGGAGNTHAAREQYYQVNRVKEMAHGWLPKNAWLQKKLTVNVNLNQTCNAYWFGGELNFFKSGGGCANSGEISGVSLHEFGHGLDENDDNGSVPEYGTQEATGDFVAALALHDSCTGPGFYTTYCQGYGDACTACTGIRDIDWAKHASNTPHTVANYTQAFCPFPPENYKWYIGPCSREGHCESQIASEALWDFVNRDLPNAGSSEAWRVAERLFYSGRPQLTRYFNCDTSQTTWTSNGCSTGSLWKVFRLLDDDDGNLDNGTPHGAALFAAFNRHGIACPSDPGASTTSTNCTLPAVPTLSATGGTNQVTLSWTPSAGAIYDLLRNESGCNAGFTPIATGLSVSSYPDKDVADGMTYYYQVIAYPTGQVTCAAPPSACLTVTLAGPDPGIRPWGAALDPPAQPYYKTADIWVDNNGNIPNEADEPSRGKTDNQLFAQITNFGNAPAASYRVSFAFKPYTTDTSAPSFNIGYQDEATPLGPGDSRSYKVSWDLSDAFIQKNFDKMFWNTEHFCAQVTIEQPGNDVNLSNNSAQNNYDNVPTSGASGLAHASFFLYNHLDHPATAGLEWIARKPGWNVRFENLADPAQIPLQAKQWLEVVATVTAVNSDVPRPRRGEPVLIDITQQLDGTVVGGLTLALQPPSEATPGSAMSPRWMLSLSTGLSWPAATMRDHYDPGTHFRLQLERILNPSFRIGLEGGYHAFAVQPALTPARDNLGVTDLALVVRTLGAASPYRPFLQAGVGAHRALGDWHFGFQAGAGLEVPLTTRVVLQGNLTAHFVRGPAGDRDLHWFDASLGFGFALP